jgi:hypothetical protein
MFMSITPEATKGKWYIESAHIYVEDVGMVIDAFRGNPKTNGAERDDNVRAVWNAVRFIHLVAACETVGVSDAEKAKQFDSMVKAAKQFSVGSV